MACDYIITTKDGGTFKVPSPFDTKSDTLFSSILSNLDTKTLGQLMSTIQTSINKKIPNKPVISEEIIKPTDNNELLDTILTEMTSKFGIQFVQFNKDNYADIQQLSVEDLNKVKAFAKDGVIYFNKTEGTIEEPLHEFMHLILNTLKVRNPTLFENIVKNMYKVEGYQQIADLYPNLTRLDLGEEAFVRLFSSKATELMQSTDLMTAVKQSLNDILQPTKDTSNISTEDLLDLSITDYINQFGSELIQGKQGLYNKTDSNLGTQILNIKQNLMESKELGEKC